MADWNKSVTPVISSRPAKMMHHQEQRCIMGCRKHDAYATALVSMSENVHGGKMGDAAHLAYGHMGCIQCTEGQSMNGVQHTSANVTLRLGVVGDVTTYE